MCGIKRKKSTKPKWKYITFQCMTHTKPRDPPVLIAWGRAFAQYECAATNMTGQTMVPLKTMPKHLWFQLVKISCCAQGYLFMGLKCKKIHLFPSVSESSWGISCYQSYRQINIEIVLCSPRSGEKQFFKVILQKVLVFLIFSGHKEAMKHFFIFSFSRWSISCLYEAYIL